MVGIRGLRSLFQPKCFCDSQAGNWTLTGDWWSCTSTYEWKTWVWLFHFVFMHLFIFVSQPFILSSHFPIFLLHSPSVACSASLTLSFLLKSSFLFYLTHIFLSSLFSLPPFTSVCYYCFQPKQGDVPAEGRWCAGHKTHPRLWSKPWDFRVNTVPFSP